MKIGRMVANDGEGIVPQEWLEASFEPKVTIDQHSRYGYLWSLIRKAAARTYEDLWNAVGHVCNLFTDEECFNFFKAAGYRTN